MARLTLRPTTDRDALDGAWWPRTRQLRPELLALFAVWPVGDGYISRVMLAPSDWDDIPATVRIPLRRGLIKIGRLPWDTQRQVGLVMLDGRVKSLSLIPPHATRTAAARVLGAFGGRVGGPAASARRQPAVSAQ